MTKIRVTGIGSLPGTDFGAALRLVFDAAPDLPWLPELPARGPWSGMIGRGLGLVDGLNASFLAGEWSLSTHPGIDGRRARQQWRDDLDMLEEAADGYRGLFKIQSVGPWTLSATTMMLRGGRVLGDHGARRDVGQALASGLKNLVTELNRRLPNLEVIVQIDEPSLPAVLAGSIPTEGGYFRHQAIEPAEVVEQLQCVSDLTEYSVLHCCAPKVPAELVCGYGSDKAGFHALSVDAATIDSDMLDDIAGHIDLYTDLWWGVLDPTDPNPHPDVITSRTVRALRPLELGEELVTGLVLTPSCGQAGTPLSVVPRAFKALREAAENVHDELLR